MNINRQVYQILLEKTKSTPGAKVENNKFCLSVHFRCVEEKVESDPNKHEFFDLNT